MAIFYKKPSLFHEFKKAHRLTRMLVFAWAKEMEEEFGLDTMITEVYRKLGGVHGTDPVRGVDVRVNGAYDPASGKPMVGRYPGAPSIQQAGIITARLNRWYIYDAGRPEKVCVFFGGIDRANRHWNHAHIQAHSNTRLVVSRMPKIKIETTSIGDGEVPMIEMKASRLSKSDIAAMTARRVGKFATAAIIGIAASKLGADPGSAIALAGSYMGGEKAANVLIENRTGKNTNLDLFSLAIEIGKMVLAFIKSRREKEVK